MKRLKELRKLKNISQQKLANDINVSRSTVAMWETQGTETDTPTLIRVAEYLGVTIDYLLGKDDVENAHYSDKSTDEMIEKLHKNPDLRILLDATNELGKEDIDFLVQLSEKMKSKKG